MKDEEPSSNGGEILWTVLAAVAWIGAAALALWVVKVTYFD